MTTASLTAGRTSLIRFLTAFSTWIRNPSAGAAGAAGAGGTAFFHSNLRRGPDPFLAGCGDEGRRADRESDADHRNQANEATSHELSSLRCGPRARGDFENCPQSFSDERIFAAPGGAANADIAYLTSCRAVLQTSMTTVGRSRAAEVERIGPPLNNRGPLGDGTSESRPLFVAWQIRT